MNRSDYKRLGNYIREVDVRNRDLAVTNLLGLSMTKQFRPSTSNIVGVDLSKYKVVNNNVFAFDPMSVIRVHKVPIALNETDSPIIVSPAYITFESIDVDLLNPQYLMMWFRRAEFDRYADFKSDSSVRGGYNWDELCETMVCIPSIERQRAMVAEYETLSRRNGLNRSMIAQLEATAQTLYRKMFVDDIDPEHLPSGWRMDTLSSFGKVITGKTPSSDNPEDFGDKITFVTPGDFNKYRKFAIGSDRMLSDSGRERLKGKILPKGSVIVTCIGSDMGKVVLASEECITNQQMNSIVVNHDEYSDYLFYALSSRSKELKSMALGSSTMPLLNKSEFEKIKCVVPPRELLFEFSRLTCAMNDMMIYKLKENNNLTELQSLLLAKMGQ